MFYTFDNKTISVLIMRIKKKYYEYEDNQFRNRNTYEILKLNYVFTVFFQLITIYVKGSVTRYTLKLIIINNSNYKI